ncbi:hypothetical protein [Nocardia sp. BMG111209]|uniref:hypothetical protein n=1 Tax=Nocardia sp. BMG111209 TaxID=1160137 RepID=UPI00035D9269|nr:hypothetical protein [Nocardia sp. BMG111209]
MSELYSTSDADDRMAAVADRHRELLRGPVAEYRERVAQRARYFGQAGPILIEQAERHITALMIDPERDRDLDVDAYRAMRDGLAVRYDTRQRVFVAQRGKREVSIRPDGPERRLGIIARLAAAGVDLDQILTVAAVVATHPGDPGAPIGEHARTGSGEHLAAGCTRAVAPR